MTATPLSQVMILIEPRLLLVSILISLEAPYGHRKLSLSRGRLNMKQAQIACPKGDICATLGQVTLLESIHQIENLYLSLPWYMPN